MTSEIYYDEDRNVIPMPLEERKEHLKAQKTRDANGNELANGDSIIAIKNLPVKGGTDIKQ
ncbi:MAG: PhnA domain-containing protein [Candidatus Peribacteria bacterium]|nr:MAG: PhnA domain-containing protein [Candidatus Peribacteria bacterium]